MCNFFRCCFVSEGRTESVGPNDIRQLALMKWLSTSVVHRRLYKQRLIARDIS